MIFMLVTFPYMYIDLESHGSQTLAHRFGLPGKTDKGSCHAELLLEQIVFSFCNRSYIVFFSLCNRSYNVFFLAVGAALYLHMGLTPVTPGGSVKILPAV